MVESLAEAQEWDELYERTKGAPAKEAAASVWAVANGTIAGKSGESQCPYCLKMYFSHSKSKGTLSETEKHFKGRCKR